MPESLYPPPRSFRGEKDRPAIRDWDTLEDPVVRHSELREIAHHIMELLEEVVGGLARVGGARQLLEIDSSMLDVDLPYVARAIWVGTGGTVVFQPPESADFVTIANVQDGTELHVEAVRISSDSTATDLVAYL